MEVVGTDLNRRFNTVLISSINLEETKTALETSEWFKS